MKGNGRMRWVFIGMVSLFASSLYAEGESEPLSSAEIQAVIADGDVINLDGVQIRGNKELPQILYIVPWQEVETIRRVQAQDIILHSITDLRIKPVMPDMDEGGSELR